MRIHVFCACGQSITVNEKLAGTQVKCSACGALLSVPGNPSLPVAKRQDAESDEDSEAEELERPKLKNRRKAAPVDSFARSAQMGCLVWMAGSLLLVILGAADVPGKMGAYLADCAVAVVIVGVVSRKKNWSYFGTAVMVFGISIALALWLMQGKFATRSAEDAQSALVHEAVMKDTTKCLQDLADILQSVRDKESARIAAKKLETLAGEIGKIAQQSK